MDQGWCLFQQPALISVGIRRLSPPSVVRRLQGKAGAALLLLGHSPLPFLSRNDGKEFGLNSVLFFLSYHKPITGSSISSEEF